MAQREDLLETLEQMRESLKETLRESSSIQRMAIEEEILIGAESINKRCDNLLRNTKRIESFLKHSRLERSEKL